MLDLVGQYNQQKNFFNAKAADSELISGDDNGGVEREKLKAQAQTETINQNF